MREYNYLTVDVKEIQNQIGGGVSESNQPEPALTVSQTVLKTAPFTGTDAPPFWKMIFRS